MRGFRHADLAAPSLAVFITNGLLINVVGFIPGVLPPANAVDSSVFLLPQTMNTEVEETVRVFGKRLEDGTALFSVSDLDNQLHDLAAIDDLLIATANRFGSSAARALKVETREIDLRVDYAVRNAPGAARTRNLRLRRPSFYPVELRAR